MLVRSSSVSSNYSRWEMNRSTASSTRTLVNKLTTSKLIMTSVSTKEAWWIRCANYADLLACASGERILANSLTSRRDGDPMPAINRSEGDHLLVYLWLAVDLW